MEEPTKSGAAALPPTPPQPPQTESKLPKGLFGALKQSLLELAPKTKGKNKGEPIPDPKFVASVNALKAESVELVSAKSNIYVVHAGSFGLRKVTLD